MAQRLVHYSGVSGARGDRLTIDCNKDSSKTHAHLPRSASGNRE